MVKFSMKMGGSLVVFGFFKLPTDFAAASAFVGVLSPRVETGICVVGILGCCVDRPPANTLSNRFDMTNSFFTNTGEACVTAEDVLSVLSCVLVTADGINVMSGFSVVFVSDETAASICSVEIASLTAAESKSTRGEIVVLPIFGKATCGSVTETMSAVSSSFKALGGNCGLLSTGYRTGGISCCMSSGGSTNASAPTMYVDDSGSKKTNFDGWTIGITAVV